MRLTKEEFLFEMDLLKQMHEDESIIVDLLDVSPEWIGGKWLWNYYSFINKMCELPINDLIGTDLDWFCWETQFGRRCNEITVDTNDGDDYKVYTIETAEDLWYYWDKETDYLRD